VEVEVSGDTATLKAGGVTKASHTFESGIVGGKVGLRVENAHSHFKEAALKSFVQVTRYYFFNGVRVALRKDNQVLYLAGDHLGTTSVVVNGSGIKMAESRHRPYGEVRWPAEDGGFPTNYRFTGQRLDSALGIYHMGARWYDPYIARWLSADTLVPHRANPQSFNRYSYVLENPLKYRDPTGHMDDAGNDSGCGLPECALPTLIQPPPGAPNIISASGSSPEQWNSGHPGTGWLASGIRSGVNQLPTYDATGRPLTPQTAEGDLPGSWFQDPKGNPLYRGEDGTIKRPDQGYTDKFENEGERPHWYASPPEGDDYTIPPKDGPGGYHWGRRGQRPTPGEWDPDRGGYYSALTVAAIASYFAYRFGQALGANQNAVQFMLLGGPRDSVPNLLRSTLE
jgi:RHS repeat-associated protein